MPEFTAELDVMQEALESFAWRTRLENPAKCQVADDLLARLAAVREMGDETIAHLVSVLADAQAV